MSECLILRWAVPDGPYGVTTGAMRAVARCETHGIDLGLDQQKCAIGLIDEATEKAIERIKITAEPQR